MDSTKLHDDAQDNWYFVSVVYRASVRGNSPPILFERRVFLVAAPNVVVAKQVGQAVAVSSELGYKNEFGEFISWKLECIEDVQELFDKNIVTGTQVYWSYFER